MHTNTETLATLVSSGTKRLLTFFFTFSFRHNEREAQFLLCRLFHLTQQTHGVSRSPQVSWPRPGSKINSPHPASNLN